jgi:hypothetical protein
VDRHRAHRHGAGERGRELDARRHARHGVERDAPGGGEPVQQRGDLRVEVRRVEQPPLAQRRGRQHAVWLAAEPQRRQRAARRHVCQEVCPRRGERVVGQLPGELVEHVAPGRRPQRGAHLALGQDGRGARAAGVRQRVDRDAERPREQRAVRAAGGQHRAALVA